MADTYTPDGAIVSTKSQPRLQLFRVSVPPEGAAPVLLHPEAEEAMGASLSPDGRMMAYTSTDTGRAEVYVRSLSGSGGKWQITHQGGNSPVWSRGGREIFYIADGAQAAVMAVPVDAREGLQVAPARELFRGAFEVRTEPITNYDVSADGRFVMVHSSQREGAARRLNVVLDWVANRLGSDAPAD